MNKNQKYIINPARILIKERYRNLMTEFCKHERKALKQTIEFWSFVEQQKRAPH